MPENGQWDDMEEVIQEFVVETKELLDGLDRNLVELEKTPDDPELLNEIFRSVHTIKGASSFLGFSEIVKLNHDMEHILNKLRQGEMEVTPKMMTVILDSVDITKGLVESIRNGGNDGGGSIDISDIVKRLEAALIEGDKHVSQEVGLGHKMIEDTLRETDPVAERQLQSALGKQSKSLDVGIDQTIRMDVERLDDLVNQVGELVLAKNRLAQLSWQASEKFRGDRVVEELTEAVAQMELVTSALQLSVMKTRLVPIGRVFSKFPRMVRDLTRNFGKEIELIISGGDTELDKSVIEEISDPLVHLLRNSADHGIELPKERVKTGKAPKGVISLSAHHEGNHVVIKIKDDGRGIDPVMLKTRAVEMGILSDTEAEVMSNGEALNLIFSPGFSTAEVVTDVSGRGVGMDVVRTNIENMNGLIELESSPGQGTEMRIRIPLTLAIIQALLTKVNEEIFAIPLASIVEIIRVLPSQVQTVERKEVLHLRDTVIPLIRLHDIFGMPPSREADRLYVVVVGLAEKKVGLITDSLIGQQEVVIKSMGEYLKSTQGISGATIMGDGHVTLIVDVGGLVKLAISDVMGHA
ncbi:MAG: chemotaxis protein CheA [Pseudomonadota bacterium]